VRGVRREEEKRRGGEEETDLGRAFRPKRAITA
jgi:hypothetical protein